MSDHPDVPIVFVHGGGGDSRTWDLLLPHLSHRRTLAVDLPGRGRHPMPFDDVNLAVCAASVAADVDAAGFDDVVLVGHSMAGCSMPGIVHALGTRVRHAVFVACTVPPDGRSAYDTVDPEIKAMVERAHGERPQERPGPMDPELARTLFANDLDEAQWAWCRERMGIEAPGLTTEPVHVAPLQTVPIRTWVRTTLDMIIPPARQLGFAENAGGCDVVDIEAGHMCMVSQPALLASIIDGAATPAPT